MPVGYEINKIDYKFVVFIETDRNKLDIIKDINDVMNIIGNSSNYKLTDIKVIFN